MNNKGLASNYNLGIREKFKLYSYRFIFALVWYVLRFIRQKLLSLYYHTIGKYAFSCIGNNVVFDGIVNIIVPCSRISIGNNCRIGRHCVFQGSLFNDIIIGNRVTINDGSIITSLFGIVIGDFTSIGEYVSIRDYDHAFGDKERLMKDQGYIGAPIKIGTNVWIGRGSVILAGVTIGDNSVIGANSTVTKDIPGNSVAVGCPAKVIKSI